MPAERFGVSMEPSLLEAFDTLLAQRGYGNRSAALREMVRRELLDAAWGRDDAPVIGAVAVVYDHHRRELVNDLIGLQHDAEAEVICTTHLHLTHQACLEVILCRGRAGAVRALAAAVGALDGVKHSHLLAIAAEELPG